MISILQVLSSRIGVGPAGVQQRRVGQIAKVFMTVNKLSRYQAILPNTTIQTALARAS